MRKTIILVLVVLAIAGCGRRYVDAPTPTSSVFQPTKTPPPVSAAQQNLQALVEQGDTLFHKMYTEVGFACETCHFVDQEAQKIGPGLLNVGTRADSRIAGEPAETYLKNSILHPNDFVVDGFTPNLMPQSYQDLLSDEEVDALVAYLMTLK